MTRTLITGAATSKHLSGVEPGATRLNRLVGFIVAAAKVLYYGCAILFVVGMVMAIGGQMAGYPTIATIGGIAVVVSFAVGVFTGMWH